MALQTSIYNCAQLTDAIRELGFLPLLDGRIKGFSADAMVDEECRYVTFPDGGWDWPMWKWKGSVITEGECVYGKFFAGKAGFISREWWPDFCNYRRSRSMVPAAGSVEDGILTILQAHDSLTTRDLRALCGFTGSKMRSLFDRHITHLQMECRIVTEDFIYPTDRHGKEYGWGWALLTTPERLYGRDTCQSPHSPDESFDRILSHLHNILPAVSEEAIYMLIS